MDSASQTSSADDDIIRSCSSICLSDTTMGETNGCCAKDIVQQLMVQLKEKDEQLKEKDQQLEMKQKEIMELQGRLDFVQAKTATDELKTKLDMAEAKQMEYEQIILTLKMSIWKSFALPHLCYYIKLVGRYLYADKDGNLLTSSDDRPFPGTGQFRFIKHQHGTFSIYSMSQEKYLETYMYAIHKQTTFKFSANDSSKINTKFELFLQQHKNRQLVAGMSVDIRSLANDCFLSKEDKWSNIVANSPTAPTNKFLIIPVDGQ